MARWTNVTASSLQLINFGFDRALQITRWFAMNRPFHFKRFDEYYGWNHISAKRTAV